MFVLEKKKKKEVEKVAESCLQEELTFPLLELTPRLLHSSNFRHLQKHELF